MSPRRFSPTLADEGDTILMDQWGQNVNWQRLINVAENQVNETLFSKSLTAELDAAVQFILIIYPAVWRQFGGFEESQLEDIFYILKIYLNHLFLQTCENSKVLNAEQLFVLEAVTFKNIQEQLEFVGVENDLMSAQCWLVWAVGHGADLGPVPGVSWLLVLTFCLCISAWNSYF